METAELLRLGIESDVLPASAAELLMRADRCSRLLLGLLKQRRKFA